MTGKALTVFCRKNTCILIFHRTSKHEPLDLGTFISYSATAIIVISGPLSFIFNFFFLHKGTPFSDFPRIPGSLLHISMKWLRIFFYPFYNTCQTVQNINIFQSVCFLPKSHIQPVLGYTYIEIQRWPVLWGNCLSGWPSFSWCYIPCPLIAVLYFLSPSSSASGFNDFFLRMKVAYFTYSQIIRHLSCNESVVSNLTDFSQFNSDTSANQKTRQLATENWTWDVHDIRKLMQAD